jgi:WD40 repeat protein
VGEPLRHSSPVWSVAYSPDGRHFATASRDETVRRWETATGRPVGEPLPHSAPVWAVAYSPHGQTLATGCGPLVSGPGEARLWDLVTGQPRGEPLRHPGSVHLVAFSPDGQTLLTGCGLLKSGPGEVRLWNAATGRPLGEPLPHPRGAAAAAFRPDGRVVVTGGNDGVARFWDTATGRLAGEFLRHERPDGLLCRVAAVAFSPNGQRVLSGTQLIDPGKKRIIAKEERPWYVGGEARVWNAATRETLGPPQLRGRSIRHVTFSPDGRFAGAGGFLVIDLADNIPRADAGLWEVESGRLVGPSMEHAQPVWALAFSPDSRLVLTGCEDASVRFWNAATALPLGPPLVRGYGTVRNVAFSPDGRTALNGYATSPPNAQVWEVPPAQVTLLPVCREAVPVWLSPDGRVALGRPERGQIRMLEVATGRPLGPPVQVVDDPDLMTRGFSSAGHWLLNRVEGPLEVRKLDSEQPHGMILKYDGPTGGAAFSADGRFIAIIAITGKWSPKRRSSPDVATEVQVWDLGSGRLAGPPISSSRRALAVALSPDGRFLVAGDDQEARFREVASGQPVGTPLPQLRGSHLLVFHPNGQVLATASGNEVWLWDFPNGQPRGAPLRHAGDVTCLIFSPDGRMVATGSKDKTVRLWDVVTGQRLGPPLRHSEAVQSIAFRPDGCHLVSSCSIEGSSTDGLLLLWEVPAPVTGEVARIRKEVEALTGAEAGEQGVLRELDADVLEQRRRGLEQR